MPVSAQQPIAGKARALDGTRLVVGTTAARLFGLTGPVAAEKCRRPDGGTWPCGWEAHMALTNLTAYQWMICDPVAVGADGLPLVVCQLGGRGGPELNLRLLGEGWAAVTADAPPAYRKVLEEAQAAGRGLWQDGAQAWPQTR